MIIHANVKKKRKKITEYSYFVLDAIANFNRLIPYLLVRAHQKLIFFQGIRAK